MATKERNESRRSLRGRMLIASPAADASPYRRSVVLVLEHNVEGASGAILDDSFIESLDRLRDQLPPAASRMNSGGSGPAAVPVKVANWKPGQLDHEVRSGLWFDLPADSQQIIHEGLPPWHQLVQEVGRSVYRDALGIDVFPTNVWEN